ncbi:MAG: hypothetical protein LBV49_01255 [Azonexus sp.]|nr:hypothetical protein [Azonexus sp.]
MAAVAAVAAANECQAVQQRVRQIDADKPMRATATTTAAAIACAAIEDAISAISTTTNRSDGRGGCPACAACATGAITYGGDSIATLAASAPCYACAPARAARSIISARPHAARADWIVSPAQVGAALSAIGKGGVGQRQRAKERGNGGGTVEEISRKGEVL